MAKDRKAALAEALRALPRADDPSLETALAACCALLVEHDEAADEAAALMCSAAGVLASVARSVGARLRVRPEKVMAATYAYAESTVHPVDCPHCEALRLEKESRSVATMSDPGSLYWRT